MSNNYKNFEHGVGVVPKSSTENGVLGDIEVLSSDSKIHFHNGSINDPIVSEAAASQGANRLKNKDLEASSTKVVDSSDTTKKVAIDVSGATTGTTTTLSFSQSTGRTVTIPNATDTLVGKATTDVLTNKTLSGNTASNLVNSSGQINFNSSGTITVPNATDTLVGKATTDVLTNKTLSGNTASSLVNGSGTLNINSTGTITVPNATDTLVGKATTDTLSNKTFGDAVSLTEISTPSNPSSGFLKLYPKTDNNLYTLNSSGVESPVGSGSGGSKNYLGTVNGNNLNGNFELGSTTGWSLAHSSLTSSFPSTVGTAGNSFSSAGGAHGGSAANGNLSISAVSSGQLAGNYSLSYASSSATTAGDMVISNAFTIDTEDQAKVMTIKCYYKAQTNPTNGDFSGTSTNSFAIAIYDVTNAAWIQPAGVYNIVQNSGVGYMTGTFQTTSNSTQYQLAMYNANASSGAITMYFDDFFLGPQTAPIGAAMGNWTSYTPTWTNLTVGNAISNFFYKRTGDSVKIVGNLYFGTTSSVSGQIKFTLPSGLNMDTTKLPLAGSNNGYARIGVVTFYVGGVKSFLQILQDNTSTNTFYFAGKDGTTVLDPVNNTSFSWGNQSEIEVVEMEVPIQGWSSNVQMSNDTDTRVIAATATTSNTSITSGSDVTVVFSSVEGDSSGSYSTSTGLFTAPVAGDYYIDSFCEFNAFSAGTSTTIRMGVIKNGTVSRYLNDFIPSATANINWAIGGSTILKNLKAGDTIGITMFQNSGSSRSLTNDSARQFASFYRLSGPAVIASTESVNARYYASSTSISGSLATISWTTKDFDSHSGMSSGTYTIPVSGKYQINSAIAITGTIALNSNLDMQLQKNGSVVSESQSYAGGAETNMVGNISDIISCLAGDTIRIQVSNSATGPSIVSSNSKNYFSISRVGN